MVASGSVVGSNVVVSVGVVSGVVGSVVVTIGVGSVVVGAVVG